MKQIIESQGDWPDMELHLTPNGQVKDITLAFDTSKHTVPETVEVTIDGERANSSGHLGIIEIKT